MRRQQPADHDVFQVEALDLRRRQRQHLPAPGPPGEQVRVTATQLTGALIR
jgi:hypothetical protein